MRSFEAEFVHLHTHTEYSLLDGAIKLSSLVQKAKDFNMRGVAITDHGNLFGAVEFYKTCLGFGIKPIIGCEVYCAPGSRRDKKLTPDIPEASFHLTLLCENLTGYKNLVRLVSLGYLEGFYYRPRVDKELLGEYSQGLIALSGCLKGEIPYYLARGEDDKAARACAEYKEIFGERFFLEVIRIGIKEEDKLIRGLLSLKDRFGLKLCATGDCHYLEREDRLAHEVMVCIQTNKRLADRKRLSFESEELWFKSPAEMISLFSDLPEAIKSSVEIAERCELTLPVNQKKFYLPAASLAPGFSSSAAYLSHLAGEGLKKRCGNLSLEQKERLEYELAVINKMGFSDYFLIIKEIIDFARRENIPVGPGRGSAVSSLCLYALGITDVNPLRYGLLFERFLNPDRVSLPDIDIDFGDKRRDEVISYIKRRYGEDRVASIITFGTLKSRAVVRDVGRVLSLPLSEIDSICKQIPFNTPLAEAIETNRELRRLFESKEEYKKLKEIALKLEGLCRHASIHASGIVIAPFTLWEMIPVYKTADNQVSTQYESSSLADLGIVKMDILGLKTLTCIHETVELLRSRGKALDINNIPFDCPKTYQLLREAKTIGVFQLESYGMRETLKKLSPEKFEDLIAVISLYRPGPLSQGNIDEFIKRRRGEKEITYFHPNLASLLEETYGMIVYQEQVMRIASLLAGFSLSQADILRQAMSKKNEALMKSMEQEFVQGAARNNIPKEKALELFNSLLPFSGYAFNKSHSVGYATISYITAYLLANYPREFLCVSLTNEIGSQETIAQWVREIKQMGIPLLPPDVNHSSYEFTLEGEGIRFGLGAIKNVGRLFAESIARERKRRPYESLFDLIKRTQGFGNRKAYEYLIRAGALSSLNPDRASLLEMLDQEMKRAASEKREPTRQFSLFEKEEERETERERKQKYSREDFLLWEKDALGFYFSSHPLEKIPEYKHFNLPRIKDLPRYNGKECSFAGLITSKKTRRDKRGEEYSILTIEDLTGLCDIITFEPLNQENKRLMRVGNCVLIRARVRLKPEAPLSCRASEIIPLASYPQWVARVVVEYEGEEKDLPKIKNILAGCPGTKEVFIVMNTEGKNRVQRIKGILVEPSSELLQALTILPAIKRVRLDFLL